MKQTKEPTMTTACITLERVRDEWLACYPVDRLAALYDRPHTPLDVLTRKDGAWSDVPARDRLWTVLRDGVLPDRLLHGFACWCATVALDGEEAAGRAVDPRSREAVRVASLHADGQATDQDLAAARAAARAAAWAAAWAAADAARAAAWAAAAAAWAAAWAAADAARAAAWAAADAAWAAAAAADAAFSDRAVSQLANMIAAEIAKETAHV